MCKMSYTYHRVHGTKWSVLLFCGGMLYIAPWGSQEVRASMASYISKGLVPKGHQLDIKDIGDNEFIGKGFMHFCRHERQRGRRAS